MKKSIRLAISLLAAGLLLAAGTAQAAKAPKVGVCHVPAGTPENYKLKLVSGNGGAVADHLFHGDWLVTPPICQDAIDDNRCDGIADDPDALNYDCVVLTGNADATCEAQVCIEPAPPADAVVGFISSDILRTGNAAGESALGDIIADAQLASTAAVGFGEAEVAFMNPGGIRANLMYVSFGQEADGEVTYGEAFSVQPFGNSLVTMTLTGDQIDILLEQQFNNPGVGVNRILQVSSGFTYTWDTSEPAGSKVDPATIKINNMVVGPTAEYRVTVNSFIADGGDNFSVLTDGTDRLGGEVDLDALVTYFGVNSPVAPGPQDRITSVP